MLVKVFVLGRPGSGKTSAFCYIRDLMKCRGWLVRKISDYEILNEMFKQDDKHQRFSPIEHGGFDVIDFSVLDDALVKVEARVRELKDSENRKELVVIEFARNNYEEAFKIFSSEFLMNAHFLFINAKIEKCLERIKSRAIHKITIDDHYVSEKILRGYYDRDNEPFLSTLRMLNEYISRCGGGTEKIIQSIDNNGSLALFRDMLGRFTDALIEQIYQRTSL